VSCVLGKSVLVEKRSFLMGKEINTPKSPNRIIETLGSK
jgi:hypothetical protein